MCWEIPCLSKVRKALKYWTWMWNTSLLVLKLINSKVRKKFGCFNLTLNRFYSKNPSFNLIPQLYDEFSKIRETPKIVVNKSKCFSVQLEISLNFVIKNKILKTLLVNFLTISGSLKDFSFFLLKNGGGPIFFWLES